jgi:hypothetical protein
MMQLDAARIIYAEIRTTHAPLPLPNLSRTEAKLKQYRRRWSTTSVRCAISDQRDTEKGGINAAEQHRVSLKLYKTHRGRLHIKRSPMLASIILQCVPSIHRG